jgi:hypothetical protein
MFRHRLAPPRTCLATINDTAATLDGFLATRPTRSLAVCTADLGVRLSGMRRPSGRGMPLFPRRLVTPPLTLKAVRQMGTAFVQLHYTVPPVSGTAAAPVRP